MLKYIVMDIFRSLVEILFRGEYYSEHSRSRAKQFFPHRIRVVSEKKKVPKFSARKISHLPEEFEICPNLFQAEEGGNYFPLSGSYAYDFESKGSEVSLFFLKIDKTRTELTASVL